MRYCCFVRIDTATCLPRSHSVPMPSPWPRRKLSSFLLRPFEVDDEEEPDEVVGNSHSFDKQVISGDSEIRLAL